MNTFMEMQIKNMLMMLETFKTSCRMAAAQDDGRVDRKEARQLARINEAADRFRAELEGLL